MRGRDLSHEKITNRGIWVRKNYQTRDIPRCDSSNAWCRVVDKIFHLESGATRRSHLQVADGEVPSIVVVLMRQRGAGRDGKEALCQATGGTVPDEVKHIPRRKILIRFVAYRSLPGNENDANAREHGPNLFPGANKMTS